MHKISFLKFHGAGNDFVLIDFRKQEQVLLPQETVKKLCHRNFGIGADGLLLLYPAEQTSRFELRYFNADGYPGSLCGNGSRCAVVYEAIVSGIFNTEFSFSSEGNLYRGTAINEEYGRIVLNDVSCNVHRGVAETGFGIFPYYFLDTGSPHAVIDMSELLDEKEFESYDITGAGKELRYNTKLFPGGTNVNFYKLSGDTVFLRTYERGVENETLACGTGAVATAIVVSQQKGNKPPVRLLSRGGATLTVAFELQDLKYTQVTLEGPVEISFAGSVLISSPIEEH